MNIKYSIMKYLIVFLTLLFFISCSEVEQLDLLPKENDLALEKMRAFVAEVDFLGIAGELSEESDVEGGVSDLLAIHIDVQKLNLLIVEAVTEQENFNSKEVSLDIVANGIQEELEKQFDVRISQLLDKHKLQSSLEQKSFPCYDKYKIQLGAASAAFSTCAIVAAATSGGLGVTGCAASYIIAIDVADRIFDSCVRNSY